MFLNWLNFLAISGSSVAILTISLSKAIKILQCQLKTLFEEPNFFHKLLYFQKIINWGNSDKKHNYLFIYL